MNYRKIAEEIVAEQVKPASNGNGFRLRVEGQDIAWCAGALVDADDPGKPTREMAAFVESVLRHGVYRLPSDMEAQVRLQRERAAAATREANALSAALTTVTNLSNHKP